MSRISIACAQMAFLLLLAFASRAYAIQQDDTNQLIAQLNDASHERRQEAETKLRELGVAALPDLELAAASSNEVAVSSVCVALIIELFESEDVQNRESAKAALTRLAETESKPVSNRSKTALMRPSTELLKWIEGTMQGIVVHDPTRAGNPVVEIKLDRTRGIDPGFSRDNIRNDDVSRLRILEELHTLTLEYRTNINDTVFEHLAKLTQLGNLNLSRTNVTGSGFADLPTTSRIVYLDLSYCRRLDESQLRELARLPELRTVALNGRGNRGWADDNWRRTIRSSLGNTHFSTYELKQMKELRGGVGDAGIEALCAASGLTDLSLICTQITDQALGQIAQLPKLRRLNLDRTAVTDAGIKLLETSPVEELSLAFTFVSDECISSLARMQNLRKLNLGNSAITARGIEQLAGLQNLEHVDLSYTLVSDKHMVALAQLRQLKELNLRHSHVSLDGLIKFAVNNPNFPLPELVVSAGLSKSGTPEALRDLSLERQKLSESSLEAVAEFQHLVDLNLGHTSITDEQLDHLRNLSKLETLDLSNTDITDSGISGLTTLRNLESIRTTGSRITFSAMRELFCDQLDKSPQELIEAGLYHDRIISKQISSKLRVDLVHRGVEDDDLATLAELENVYSIKLAGNPLTDEGIRQLSADSEMELLWISGEGITGASLQHLASFPRLKILWVTDAAVDSDALSFLVDFKSLECVNLCGCPIDEFSVDQLAQLSSLKTLIVDVNALSKEGVTRLQRLLPDLEIIGSTQGVVRLVSRQPTLYQYLPGRPEHRLGSRHRDHPLQRLFGTEFFQEIRSLVLPDAFDCSCLIGLDSVESISFGENVVREDSLSYINHLPALKRISLYRSHLADDELRHLSGMTQLEQLNLARSTVTNEGLKHLWGMYGLKSLSLGGGSGKLTPGWIRCLDDMPDLQELDVFRAPVTDDDLQQIARLKKLRKLNLREARVGEGIQHLLELPQLEELELGNTFITDRELAMLASLNLKRLSIGNTFVTENGVREFRQSSPETRLFESGILSNELLEILEPLRQKRIYVGRNANQHVRYLDVRKIELDPGTIDLLGKLPEFEDLRFTGVASDRLIQILADKPAFRSLTISRGSISKRQLERLYETPSFNSLNLYDCQITREALEFIGSMTRLQRLALYKTRIDGQVVNDDHVASLGNLGSLTWLNLNDTVITDEAMKTIESFRKMQRLFLNRTHVTDAGVYPVTRWPQLSEITAVGTRVTRNAAKYGQRRVETRSSR